jgi:hypothetical protein
MWCTSVQAYHLLYKSRTIYIHTQVTVMYFSACFAAECRCFFCDKAAALYYT